jgi:hypothetical protein
LDSVAIFVGNAAARAHMKAQPPLSKSKTLAGGATGTLEMKRPDVPLSISTSRH